MCQFGDKQFQYKRLPHYHYLYFKQNKCGHRNVLSKRQVWMSIFHIINLKKKKNHGHRGPGLF